MGGRRVCLLLYWGGEIINGEQGWTYDKPQESGITLKEDSSYEELVDKVYSAMGIDRKSSTLKMTCRCPLFVTTTTCNYFLHEIKDEGSLEFAMATVSNVPSVNAIDLYIEKVDLNYDVYPIGENLPLSEPCRSPPLTKCTPTYNGPLQPHEFSGLVNEGRPPKLFSSGSSFGLSSSTTVSTTCGAETTDSKAKTENKTTFGNENGSHFTLFPVTSAGSSPFGFGSSVTNPMANNQSTPLFGTESGSLVSTQPSSFGTGYSPFPSSISGPKLFSLGSSFGLSSSTSSSEITSVSSSSGPTSFIFDSSWQQPNKSPLFASALSSPTLSTGFMLGSTTPSPSNPNPFQFGSQQSQPAPQNPSPFQSLFNAGGSFSLGGDELDEFAQSRRTVRLSKSRNRKK